MSDTMDNETAATEHAVRYQLMSEWTNYIVVHVRAEGEKTDDLPKILKVPQVIAAGWHGMGTVFSDQRDVRAKAHFERASSPLRDANFSLRSMDERLHEVLQEMVVTRAGVIAPPELVELLNARPMPPFPTLDDFEIWDVPESIVENLRGLVELGEDEEAVVLALLYLLSESEAGQMLERQVRRKILKAYKTHRPDAALISRMQDVFRSWHLSRGSAA